MQWKRRTENREGRIGPCEMHPSTARITSAPAGRVPGARARGAYGIAASAMLGHSSEISTASASPESAFISVGTTGFLTVPALVV